MKCLPTLPCSENIPDVADFLSNSSRPMRQTRISKERARETAPLHVQCTAGTYLTLRCREQRTCTDTTLHWSATVGELIPVLASCQTQLADNENRRAGRSRIAAYILPVCLMDQQLFCGRQQQATISSTRLTQIWKCCGGECWRSPHKLLEPRVLANLGCRCHTASSYWSRTGGPLAAGAGRSPACPKGRNARVALLRSSVSAKGTALMHR